MATNAMIAIAIYLVCVNALAFAAFGVDKARAQRGAWRISEKALMALAVAGGGIGAFAGMQAFRHKIRKPLFRYGVPALLAFWLLAGALVVGAIGRIPHVENFQTATVEYVVDGDTVDVIANGEAQRVRLIGIDAPESVNSNDALNTEEGEEAAEYLRSLLEEGDTVYLQADQEDRDHYNRLLRYLWIELPQDPRNPDEIAAKMVNAIIVANGYADTMRYEPNTYYADEFETLKERAISEGLGVSYLYAEEA